LLLLAARLCSPVGVIKFVQTPYIIGEKALDRAPKLGVVAGHVLLQVFEQIVEFVDPTD
jgi:hypothetical protein